MPRIVVLDGGNVITSSAEDVIMRGNFKKTG